MTTRDSREIVSQEDARLIAQIEKKHGKTIEQLRDERDKRIKDVIELREPDQVPVAVGTGIFAARYSGLTASAMYYDHDAFRKACKKVLLDFEPDGGSAMGSASGLIMELLDERDYKWPGGNLPVDIPFQFVEAEYMKADEYDIFLKDPSDFVLRYYLPRMFGLFAPLPQIKPLRTQIFGSGIQGLVHTLGSPEFKAIGEALAKAEAEQARLRKADAELTAEMRSLGFPSPQRGTGITFAPFDTISDRLRGMKGAMLDIYRQPDKLLAAIDKVMEWWTEQAVPAKPDAKGNPIRVPMPLHRGSDGFMSKKQFEKFYWPTLKKSIMTNIEMGYVAAPFWEGIWDDRLEYLLEFPRAKVVFHAEKTDLFKAKQVLGNTMCIEGGVPPTLLQAGSPQEVEEHCKKLIDVVGKGGGFILGAGSAIDYAKPENIRVMVDTARTYGRY